MVRLLTRERSFTGISDRASADGTGIPARESGALPTINFFEFYGFDDPLLGVSKRSGAPSSGGCPDYDAVWRLTKITREET